MWRTSYTSRRRNSSQADARSVGRHRCARGPRGRRHLSTSTVRSATGQKAPRDDRPPDLQNIAFDRRLIRTQIPELGRDPQRSAILRGPHRNRTHHAACYADRVPSAQRRCASRMDSACPRRALRRHVSLVLCFAESRGLGWTGLTVVTLIEMPAVAPAGSRVCSGRIRGTAGDLGGQVCCSETIFHVHCASTVSRIANAR
jgi:hypothetical protein